MSDLFSPRGTCEWCGGMAVVGSTCPRGVICPTCRAAPGNPCRRPSGHRSDVLHATRVAFAEQLDACNEAEPLDEMRRRLPLTAPLPHGEGRRLV